MILREFDGYPAFFKGRLKSVERPFSRGVLAVIRWVGGWFWLKGWYEEYTPFLNSNKSSGYMITNANASEENNLC